MKKNSCAIAVAAAMIAPAWADLSERPSLGVAVSPDPSGLLATVDVNGPTRTNGAFFQSLGTNGRSCASCHVGSPGKALITGKCADFNRTKGPILRGLAARAPYFHNGAAANLEQVVNFYNERFPCDSARTRRRSSWPS